MNRRRVLALLGTTILSVGNGCSELGESQSAHTVNVYDNDPPHNVSVTVLNENDERLYHETYEFDEDKNADEAGGFAVGTNPQTVVITIDGEEYEEPWPTPDCSGPNHAALEVHINYSSDRPVYIDGFCESETLQQ